MFKNLLEILKNHFLECFKTGLWLNASGIKIYNYIFIISSEVLAVRPLTVTYIF